MKNNIQTTISNQNYMFHRTCTNELIKEYQLHCHTNFEVFYFISGDISYMVEGKIYNPKPSSIILLRPNIVHGVKTHSEDDYIRYAFHFREDFISEECRELLLAPFYGNSIYFEDMMLDAVFDRVISAKKLPDEKLMYFALKCRLEALLTEIFPLANVQGQDPHDTLAFKISNYINSHLRENLSLDIIANEFYISKSQLGRIFNDNLGTTVANYISLKRCTMAKELIQRGSSATLASIECGFNDYSTFFRSYKKFIGENPSLKQ